MEIQKVFSDGEERYYSVLMSEEELEYFQKEFAFNFGNLGKKMGIGLTDRQKAARSLNKVRVANNRSAQARLNEFAHPEGRKFHLPKIIENRNNLHNRALESVKGNLHSKTGGWNI